MNTDAKILNRPGAFLATSEAKIRRIVVQSQHLANSLQDPILEKTHHKKGLVEWLKW
jgi:hypothetical protein